MKILKNSSLIIRRYKKSDKKDVWNLHVTPLKDAHAYIGSGQWDKDMEDIENVYLKNGEFLVGETDGKIVAIGAFKKISSEIAEIKRMRVLPGYQRNGFGQAIFDRLQKKAVGLGFKKIRLDTSTRQKAAQKFYEKNGFKEIRRGLLGGLETIYYEKVLKEDKTK